MTEKQKKVLSEKRKDYFRKNPDKHPWKRNDKFKSAPCEFIKTQLRESDIKFIEEYQPLYPDRFFSIDIAFPDKKIGIEINGNQHYTNEGELNDYYQKRHDLIEKAGWKLYEFHYSTVYNGLLFSTIEKILEGAEISENFDYEFWISTPEKKRIKRIEKEKEKRKEKEERLTNIRYNLLISEIEFSKFGWVEPASKIIGITPQKVGKWMERNIPDLYEKCYVRNRPVSSAE